MKNEYAYVKINISSLQVLKTFKTLLENNYTMDELIARLNSNEVIPQFNNSVISKYINTCRYCGIKIPKINNKYIITSIPFGIDITCTDIDIIKEFQDLTEKVFSAKNYRCFKNFLNCLFRYANKDLRNSDITKKIPIRLTEKEMESLKTNNTVIFKIKGELIKRYHLRENEYIIEENMPEYITVVNKNEDKDALFTRLFRYAELCEIEHPKFYREEIKEILKYALLNYGENVDE